MPYLTVLNARKSLSHREAYELIKEFDKLRQELDEIRANYNAVLAKLDADAGVTDTNYVSTLGLAASTVAASAAPARRFTPT